MFSGRETNRPALPPLVLCGAAIALVMSLGCFEGQRRPGEESPAAGASVGQPIFIERAQEVGLDFAHFNGMSGKYYLVEIMGGGVALFDYDNDGDLDVYLVQGHMLGKGVPIERATDPPRYPLPLTDRLYRNDLPLDSAESERLRFTDVTEESGILSRGYGMGVAAADFDNDGWVDLYVTNYGANQLLRNRGDGTFEDVTRRSGAEDERWSVAATFFDYDRDGWLDLYVGNYLQFYFGSHTPCQSPEGIVNYCAPAAYPKARDSLFHNRGDGTFDNVSGASGIGAGHTSSTLGAVSADFDSDGWIDLYVANDSMANDLWMNQGDGRFQNQALLAGAALNEAGQPEASMGVDAGDFDGDGDADLILAHLDHETNTVYVNRGSALFEDVSMSSGLGLPSLGFTAFGASWFDYDNDGWLDLLTVNGGVLLPEDRERGDRLAPMHQTNQLFHNLGAGLFEEVTESAGGAFELSGLSRGAAFGDVDNDGDTDVVVVNNNGPVRLLLNQIGQDRSWLGLRVEAHGRVMLGAEVALLRDQGRLWRRVHTDGSYASASDPRVLFGLGDGARVDRVEVRWGDGSIEEWSGMEVGRYTILRQGEGHPIDGEASARQSAAYP